MFNAETSGCFEEGKVYRQLSLLNKFLQFVFLEFFASVVRFGFRGHFKALYYKDL